jgi:hypothetical protein
MEGSRGNLPNDDQVPSSVSARWGTIAQKPGLHEWSGRFWLPAGCQIEPTRMYCLIRDDGRIGEMILERFGLNDIDGDVAVFQGNRRFA